LNYFPKFEVLQREQRAKDFVEDIVRAIEKEV